MIAVTFRPLRWDGPKTPADDRRQSPFRAGFKQTLDLLDIELWHLDARDVVVELDIAESDLRRDGWPRATARPAFPGVRLAFASKHGPLIYATDSCAFWQDNLRSIALGLEALRAVDRYGVTKRGEQYRGWAALPAAPAAGTKDAAAAEVGRLAGWDTSLDWMDPSVVRLAVRKAARRCHPDTGGARADWDALVAAAKTLGVPL